MPSNHNASGQILVFKRTTSRSSELRRDTEASRARPVVWLCAAAIGSAPDLRNLGQVGERAALFCLQVRENPTILVVKSDRSSATCSHLYKDRHLDFPSPSATYPRTPSHDLSTTPTQVHESEQPPAAAMAFVANSLRHLLGRGQSSSSSSPDSIARFDGTSEAPSQQMHQTTSLEQANTDATVAEEGSSPPVADQNAVPQRENASQPEGPHRYDQSSEQLVIPEDGQCSDYIHSTAQLSQVSGCDEHDQFDEWGRQIFSRTATAQPSETPQHHTNSNGRSYTAELPQAVSYAGSEVRVKQEPTLHEHDDHGIFDEFTNGDLYHDDARTTVEGQAVSKAANYSASDPPMIKQEPELQSQPLAEAVAPADIVMSTVTPAMAMQQTQEISADNEPQTTRETIATTSRTESELAHPQWQVSSVRATPTDGIRQQCSFDQYAQVPQQSNPGSQLQPSSGKILRSPSVDSVIGAPRHGSEETASTLNGMDLSANSQFAQQWNERPILLGNGTLTADAVNATPVLLHGPLPAREQSNLTPAMVMRQSHSLSSYQTQPMNGTQYNSTFPYNTASNRPAYPMATQHGQALPSWLTQAWAFDSATSQTLPSTRPATQGPQANFQKREVSQVSDDDEPLVTRAPRHRSSTTSPMPANASSSCSSRSTPGSDAAAPKPSIPSVKQDAVIELSDDDDEDAAAAFSWKLPDFEVTYHAPAPGQGLHMAKVSTLGQEKNLVRSEILLTEDHHCDEMELFLNVFLPAQQALQTPDPQPAHAVINFHTISVMVLEAFVQYEIGDEMGRGYGFHGGNIGDQPLRPSTSSLGDEPTRIRSAKDADVDEIFFAVIDRWRAGMISGKGTLKLVRGCQEFCDIALDVIHYVKEHGLSQPEPKKRKERSDKGVKRGPQGGAKDAVAKGKTAGKRKADAVEGKAPAKKGKVNELQGRKKAKTEVKKTKPKSKVKSPGVTVIKK